MPDQVKRSASKQRVWLLNHVDYETEPAFHDATVEAFVEAAGIIRRIGGHFQCASDRMELEDGTWVNATLIFRWTSFVPHAREQEREPESVGAA